MRYTYSRWDGTQSLPGIEPDELMDALSDDLLSDSDVCRALKRVMSWGIQQDGRPQALGLQHLLHQLRSQRRHELQRYDLDSAMQGISDQVADAVDTERRALDARLRSQRPPTSDAQHALESVVARKRAVLNRVPPEPASAIAALAEYEFLDREARVKFEVITETLRRHVLQRHFESIEHSVGSLSGDILDDFRHMLHDLNDLLDASVQGDASGFDHFIEEHGSHFPDAGTLDELLDGLCDQSAGTAALLAGMSSSMRTALEESLEVVLHDAELRQELGRMAETLESVRPGHSRPQPYPFHGETDLSLDEALRLMRRMRDLERIERSLQAASESGDLSAINPEALRRSMGSYAETAIERLQGLTRVLAGAGYVDERGGTLELTVRGIRRIGQKALNDIFAHIRRDTFGEHVVAAPGAGGDVSVDTKTYEFGDAFFLDLSKTVMNSVVRRGGGLPVVLGSQDFEIFRTESLTQAATVVLVDMSRSMPLRGCFVAAKKVALALNSLIRTQFPRDRLYIVTFSDIARQVSPEALHQMPWGDHVHGTNMQHGFMVARRLLGRHKSSTRQVILITDGEPTAHMEGTRIQFAYPPTPRTFQETLREVKRCTQEGIIINTFMLERSRYLADFVTQMTRINRGRAFFTTPERLGDFVLVDYVAAKRRTKQ